MAIPLTDLITWFGYILYLLGAILLWVYTRDHRALDTRVTSLEKNCPDNEEVRAMIKSALYDDITRP